LKLNLSLLNLCDLCLSTTCLSLTFATTKFWSVSQSAALNDQTSNNWNAFAYLSHCGRSVCGFSHLEILRCGNIILFTLRFLDMTKFTNLTPVTLVSHKLSFSTVGLKMSSLPTLVLKSVV
jgi:hypothetical protein